MNPVKATIIESTNDTVAVSVLGKIYRGRPNKRYKLGQTVLAAINFVNKTIAHIYERINEDGLPVHTQEFDAPTPPHDESEEVLECGDSISYEPYYGGQINCLEIENDPEDY